MYMYDKKLVKNVLIILFTKMSSYVFMCTCDDSVLPEKGVVDNN